VRRCSGRILISYGEANPKIFSGKAVIDREGCEKKGVPVLKMVCVPKAGWAFEI